jgi:ketosteroid isomerase-like protein
MSRENVEIVREVYAEWENGNLRAGVHLFEPDTAFISYMPDSSESIVTHGVDGIEAFMREFLAQWRDYRLWGTEFRAVGSDKVLVKGRQSAAGRHSGVAVEDDTHSIWTFRDGKVAELRFEREWQRAVEAAGFADQM